MKEKIIKIHDEEVSFTAPIDCEDLNDWGRRVLWNKINCDDFTILERRINPVDRSREFRVSYNPKYSPSKLIHN